MIVTAKKIDGYSGYYVTNTGDVYSRVVCNTNPNGRIKRLKPLKSITGYLHIKLSKKQHYIHRIVAKTFIPNPDNKPEVNHKNGNKQDNCVNNLEWVNHIENMKHRYDVLKQKVPTHWKNRFGKDNYHSKVLLQLKDGLTIAKFYGAKEANRITGIDFSSIAKCCRGIRQTAGGFQWKYKQED